MILCTSNAFRFQYSSSSWYDLSGVWVYGVVVRITSDDRSCYLFGVAALVLSGVVVMYGFTRIDILNFISYQIKPIYHVICCLVHRRWSLFHNSINWIPELIRTVTTYVFIEILEVI